MLTWDNCEKYYETNWGYSKYEYFYYSWGYYEQLLNSWNNSEKMFTFN